MGGDLHLVGLTADGCRIARDGDCGYLVLHEQTDGRWQRAANLPTAYAVCERLSMRDVVVMPRRRQQA
jgi:hypothetical protein